MGWSVSPRPGVVVAIPTGVIVGRKKVGVGPQATAWVGAAGGSQAVT